MVWRKPGSGTSKLRWLAGSPVSDADADGDAVIALQPADDLLLLRPAERVVEVPDHLDGGVVRLGAGVGEEHLAHRHRRALDQHLREVDHRLVRFGGERVVERQLAHLVGGGLHQAFVVEAERGAPQAGDAFDVFLAGVVPHAHALAARDHHRADLLVRLQVGVGMQHVGDVARGGGIGAERRGRGHDRVSLRYAAMLDRGLGGGKERGSRAVRRGGLDPLSGARDPINHSLKPTFNQIEPRSLHPPDHQPRQVLRGNKSGSIVFRSETEQVSVTADRRAYAG